MSIEQTKNQILEHIKKAKKLDFKKLYGTGSSAQPWNQQSGEELKKYVDSIRTLLAALSKNIDLLDTAGFDQATNLNNNLANFIGHFAPLENLTNDQITTHHHNSLNNLHAINNILRNTGIYAELKSVPDLDKRWTDLTGASDLASKLLEKNEDLDAALVTVDQLIKKREQLSSAIVNDNNNFNTLASKYKQKDWLWLLAGIVFAALTLGVFKLFILGELDTENITVGSAILRISALIIPSYLTYFAFARYTHLNEMYDWYSFKDSVVGNMKGLTNLYGAEFDQQLLADSVKVLLSEPEKAKSAGRGKIDEKHLNKAIEIVTEYAKRSEG